MIELNQLTLLIMIEVILALAILCCLLGYFALTRKERIRKAAHHLAERVQSDKPARTERLQSLLSEEYGLTGQEFEQALRNITQAEMRLFQNLINGYMEDDQVHLQQVDVDEENLVRAYQDLKPPQGAAVAAAPQEEDADEEELLRLRDENQRLSDELRVTMDTMGRMLNEYSSMFSGGTDKPLTKTAAEPPAETPSDAQESEPPSVTPTEDEGDGLEIPEFNAEEVVDDPDKLLDNKTEASSILEEEVSEIIDEVMEIADETARHEEEESEAQAPAADSGESLLDELEQVDIELTDTSPSAQSEASDEDAETENAPEPGSLEEEWAKLLEEDAASKEKPEQK